MCALKLLVKYIFISCLCIKSSGLCISEGVHLQIEVADRKEMNLIIYLCPNVFNVRYKVINICLRYLPTAIY